MYHQSFRSVRTGIPETPKCATIVLLGVLFFLQGTNVLNAASHDIDSSGNNGGEPAASWSTHQHDAQRTGRTSAVVPDNPLVLWQAVIGEAVFRPNSPAIGPNGEVYIAGPEKLVAFTSEGDLLWHTRNFPRSAATVRADGNIWLSGFYGFDQVDKTDGSLICRQSGSNQYPSAITANGDVYFGSVTKLDSDCTPLWAYPSPTNSKSHIALAIDGGALITTGSGLLKIQPDTPLLEWVYPVPSSAGDPVVDSNGTIYLTIEPDTLLALNPDGTEKWTHIFTDPLFKVHEVDTQSPAIGEDGTIYVPGLYNRHPAVLAISSSGIEQWSYVESRNHYVAPSPVVDGEGKVIFPSADRLVALSPVDGSILWDTELGYAAKNAPAVGEDGTVYLVVEDRLLAIGVGCPAIVTAEPRFTFRLVAEINQDIGGHIIDGFEDFQIRDDGTIAFKASQTTPNTSVLFVEQSDGTFDILAPGDRADGYHISDVSVPRVDILGNTYMSANTEELGHVLYVNGVVFIQTGSPTMAPLGLSDFEFGYVDPNDVGQFTVRGKRIGDRYTSILRIDRSTNTITPLVTRYDTIDDITVESLDIAWVDGFGNDGNIVFSESSGGQFALLTQNSVLARTGDEIDGEWIGALSNPRRTQSGSVFCRGAGLRSDNLYKFLLGSTGEFVTGTGDTIAGEPILSVESYAINDAHQATVYAGLLGERHGVFLDEEPVVVESVTKIFSNVVINVNSTPYGAVSMNRSGQVAFIAELSDNTIGLFVATPAVPFDSNMDGSIDLLDYQDFTDCLDGPATFIERPECRIFDVDNDCRIDMADFAYFQELMTADCNENDIPDFADILAGTSSDCDGDQIPDECEADCNTNGYPDDCEIAELLVTDCDGGGVPDSCELANGTASDMNTNGIPDVCEEDCNNNNMPDDVDLASGTSADCNGNNIPDECDVALGNEEDCNRNNTPDSCDIATGSSEDCSGNGTPDECEPDCNGNGQADICEIMAGTAPDCDSNNVPDSCDISGGTASDCNSNGIPDTCEDDCDGNGIPDDCEPYLDCNFNGQLDVCDIAEGHSADLNANSIPDECEADCNSNSIPDLQELFGNDCNENAIPDDCELPGNDCNDNDILDECELVSYQLAYQIDGESSGDLFGYTLEAVDDVNGDGLRDLLVSALFANDSGSVSLFGLMPDSATLLMRMDGYDRFGSDLAALGDITGDSIPDFAVGSAFDDTFGMNAGTIVLVSGADRTIGGSFNSHPGTISSFTRSGSYVGGSIGGNPDSGELLLVTRAGSGHAFVIDSATQSNLTELVGGGLPRTVLSDVCTITSIPDIIGNDGIRDLAIGESGYLNGSFGTIFIVDGALSTTLPTLITPVASFTFVGTQNNDHIGTQPQNGGRILDSIGDVNGDGVTDFITGTFQANMFGQYTGAILIFSGDGSGLIYRIDGSAYRDHFGSSVAAIGDMSGNSVPDYCVGSPGDPADPNHHGYVYTYSPKSGSLLQTLTDGTPGFGETVLSIGDLNGDGREDLAVSNIRSYSSRGTVYIYLSIEDSNGNGLPDECDGN